MRSAFRGAMAVAALTFAYPLVHVDGHAILRSTAPAVNEVVQGEIVHIQLQFNSRIDVKRSRLILILPTGSEQVLPADQPSADTVRSDVTQLLPGLYILRWQVLAEDGHITRGELPFRTQ